MKLLKSKIFQYGAWREEYTKIKDTFEITSAERVEEAEQIYAGAKSQGRSYEALLYPRYLP